MLFSGHQEGHAQRKPTDADEKWIPPRDVQQKRAPFGTAAKMGIAAIWIQDIVRFGSWLQLPHLRGWTDFKAGKTGQMISDFCGSKGRHIYYIYIDRCISSFLSKGHNLMQKSSSLMLSGNLRGTCLESDLQLLFVTGKTSFKITMNSLNTTSKDFHTTIRISFRIESVGFFSDKGEEKHEKITRFGRYGLLMISSFSFSTMSIDPFILHGRGGLQSGLTPLNLPVKEKKTSSMLAGYVCQWLYPYIIEILRWIKDQQ